jgi:hypothetical protein
MASAVEQPVEPPAGPPAEPAAPPRLEESVAENELRLIEFVRRHGGMRQRDPSWYTAMGETVGGSELSALLGQNPYSTFLDVVLSKVALLQGRGGFAGGPACWWGTLFEDEIGAHISQELGARMYGDEICIRQHPGHRNSPDGYMVARVYTDPGGVTHLITTDPAAGAPPEHAVARIVLLEFKCPLRRRPRAGVVPPQYMAQMWSGLAVSEPITSLGLYAEAVYRKCALHVLGAGPSYDTVYHGYDRGEWHTPIAWGVIGVYAPAGGSPAASAILEECGVAASDAGGVVDMGTMSARLFEAMLGHIDHKDFPVVRTAGVFADGRAGAPRPGAEYVSELRARAPPGHTLLGLLPWKLFCLNKVLVQPRRGFMAEVAPLIAEVHNTVAAALASEDPSEYVRTVAASRPAARGRSAPGGRRAALGFRA